MFILDGRPVPSDPRYYPREDTISIQPTFPPNVIAVAVIEPAVGQLKKLLGGNASFVDPADCEGLDWSRVRVVVAGSLEAARAVRRNNASAPILLIAQHSSEEFAIQALRAGVTDYLRVPFQPSELTAAVFRYAGELAPRPSSIGTGYMIGDGDAMRSVRTYIGKAAGTDSSVLITGETGTGKELVAELLHKNSARAHKPLVCINCAAIPDSLLESELFGYERGAFTGALTATQGKLELANGGTVFFDEIGEMTPFAQAKILRVTEGKEIYRLGGRKSISLNLRIIAATNRDLETMAMEDRFRKDLYYRLNVGRVHLPPLRERKCDIPALVDHYMKEYNTRFGAAVHRVSREALDRFMEYPWPGNIRELKNVIESVFVSRPASEITMTDLPDWFRRCALLPKPPQSEAERLLLTLRECNWNKSAAAEKLDWSRMTIYRKMAKYHLRNGTEA